MGPFRVVVRRGGTVEAVHRVHVASSDGLVAGDDIVSHLRSAAKPMQAIPLLEAYDDLGDDELAIACASHQAEPAQLDAVRRLLARAGATVDDLENGPQEGRPEGRLGHNCSGKHAGFLAACRANGWPFAGYRLPGHPLQLRIRELLGGGEPATDGCGIPTYAQPLTEQARLLLRTPDRIADAMRARPELVGGDGADDTALMRALPGFFAKRGAEGLLCTVAPDGRGYAFKVEDGNGRALRPAVAAVLGIESFERVPLENSRGERVGEISLD
ncbi:MAG TPA: asparaginase [Gaiellaceae bacterium]